MLFLQTPCPLAMPFIAKTNSTLITPMLKVGWVMCTKQRDFKEAQESETQPGLLQVQLRCAWSLYFCELQQPKILVVYLSPTPVPCKIVFLQLCPFPCAYAHRCICRPRHSSMHFSTSCCFFPSGRKLSFAVQLWCYKDSVQYQCHIPEPGLHPACRKTAQCRQMCPVRERLFLRIRFKINTAIKTFLCQSSLLCNIFISNIQPNTCT